MNSIQLTAFYTFDGLNSAQLRISAELMRSYQITAIVARLTDATVSHFAGNEASEPVTVYDTDRVIILVDRLGDLVAHGVYEVCTALVEQGYLLMPRGGANILLEQCEQLRQEDLDSLSSEVRAMLAVPFPVVGEVHEGLL